MCSNLSEVKQCRKHQLCHTCNIFSLSLLYFLLFSITECSHVYRDAPGFISDLFTTHQPTYTCRYHVYAPSNHYIKLNITGLIGHPMSEECLPRLVIKNIGKSGIMTNLQRLCNQGDTPLPLVVQSTYRKLIIVFRGHDRQISSFNATFTFHHEDSGRWRCSQDGNLLKWDDDEE